MRRAVAQLVLLILLGGANAPNLIAAYNPALGACCRKAGGCGCEKNGRACYCKRKRPVGWWGPEQRCPARSAALVQVVVHKFLRAEPLTITQPMEYVTPEAQTESYARVWLSRPSQRAPPLFS
jgi:hypothetical protein